MTRAEAPSIDAAIRMPKRFHNTAPRTYTTRATVITMLLETWLQASTKCSTGRPWTEIKCIGATKKVRIRRPQRPSTPTSFNAGVVRTAAIRSSMHICAAIRICANMTSTFPKSTTCLSLVVYWSSRRLAAFTTNIPATERASAIHWNVKILRLKQTADKSVVKTSEALHLSISQTDAYVKHSPAYNVPRPSASQAAGSASRGSAREQTPWQLSAAGPQPLVPSSRRDPRKAWATKHVDCARNMK
mmetsp:Transcript_100386/g.312813  ORF Transcript_100386/g.312813 Transcript_100386/m.312813 type:complete len:245 (-) Transcript_100386:232-966(-)